MKWLEHFSLTDRESCEAAMRRGGFAALVSSVIHALSAVSVDAWEWDAAYAALAALLAIFIFLRSRVAASLMLVNFAASKFLIWATMGIPSGWILTLVVFLYLWTAARAAVLMHSEHREKMSLKASLEDVV